MRVIVDKRSSFLTYFNEKNGFYLRTGVLDSEGRDTGIEPERSTFPHLIDVGIMGHCQHGLAGKCKEMGNHCYQNGSSVCKPNMDISLFRKIAEESAHKTFQFALGGRGDPNKHECFAEILEICGNNEIVPNYTTSGFNITTKEIDLTVNLCGSVAISWYNASYTMHAINEFFKRGKPVNIHYVVSQHSLLGAMSILNNYALLEKVNAIVFLLYKPIGDIDETAIVHHGCPNLDEFMSRIGQGSTRCRIGFDSCFVPGLIRYNIPMIESCLEPCESGRFSCYIDAAGFMTPCSFIQKKEYTRQLGNMTIQEIWDSLSFGKFCKNINSSCLSCKNFCSCNGGCHELPQINLCGGAC